MQPKPPSRRPNHARLVWTAVALSVAMVIGAAVLGFAAWETTRKNLLNRVVAANLDVARVLAEDLSDEWGGGEAPVSLQDLVRYWEETESLYPGSLQVIGPGGLVLYDSRGLQELGVDIGEHPVPSPHGTLGALAASGEDWAGLRADRRGVLEAVAFANVPDHDALVAVRVPYEVLHDEAVGLTRPWATALAAVAAGAGPLSLLLLHRAYRLSIAETARAQAAMERYAARLRTLQLVDRAILAAGSPGEVAAAALSGVADVVPLRAAWVCVPDEGGGSHVVASIPPGDAEGPPPGASVVRVPFRAGPSDAELIVDVPTADALEREDRDVLSEVADVLSVALWEAHLHQQVARHAVELQARVDERTAELQEAVHEMEGFNYTVAHDLRAPLRSMAGLADVVRLEEGAKLDPSSVELLVGISDSAKRLDRLVIDLLSYARLGRESAAPVPVDLDAAVKAAVHQARAETDVPDAQFTVEHPLPGVLATPPLLAQVLANLLSNAVKFVPPGRRPHVRIRAVRRGGRVRVEVRDNGVGVPPEHRERIFRVFERLHGQAFPGTGVGLAIVRRAIERMGGTVGVEADEASTGSIFWFMLPSAEGAHARPAKDSVARGG